MHSTPCVHLVHINCGHLEVQNWNKHLPSGMESHLTHCDVEKCETELLGALDRPEEKGEGGDSTTGVPEHWLPPRSRIIPSIQS